jgi:HEAT repeat protein
MRRHNKRHEPQAKRWRYVQIAITLACFLVSVGESIAQATPDLEQGPVGTNPIDPELLRKFAADLSSKNYEERSAALAALAKLVPAKADQQTDFGPLIEPLFRRAGWGGIAKYDARVAEDLLVRIGKPALPLLKARLQSEDAHDRRVAIELLVRIGPLDEALADLVRRRLPDRDGYVRRIAIEGLATIGAPAKDAITDLESLAKLELNHTRRVSVRVALIRIAGASEERVQALAAFLEPMIYIDEPMAKGRKTGLDYESARFAASELGRLGITAKAAEPQLLAALKLPQLRSTAVHALGDIGANSPETITALIDILKKEPHREARRSAAWALGEIGPLAKAAIPALREAVKGDGQRGWYLAADALGKIGGAEVVPILIEALTNPDEDIRRASMIGLGNLGVVAQSAVKDLENASQADAREHNRTAAIDALRRIEQAMQKSKTVP